MGIFPSIKEDIPTEQGYCRKEIVASFKAIVALLDINGATTVEYKYDAWGKPLSTTGTMADTLGKLNLFRYRGYVYDEETGLYYLRSRYYAPQNNIFLNEDIFLGEMGTLNEHHCFRYCFNNPVSLTDDSGCSPKWWPAGTNGKYKRWSFRIENNHGKPIKPNQYMYHIHLKSPEGNEYTQNEDGKKHDKEEKLIKPGTREDDVLKNGI